MTKTLHVFAIFFLLLCGAFGLSAQQDNPSLPEPKPEEPRRIGHPNDPAARAFLREAEERGTTWNGFSGFSAEVMVYSNGRTHRGEVAVSGNGKARLDLGDSDARKWASGVLGSIGSASSRKDFEDRYENVGVVFGKDDLHPLGQLVELRGDVYNTRFRILDKEVRVIERTTPSGRIVVHIVSVQRDEEDRKLARSFVVHYFDPKTEDLVRSESIRDTRTIVDGYVLLESWVETTAAKDGISTRSMSLSEHKVNGEEPIQSARRPRQ